MNEIGIGKSFLFALIIHLLFFSILGMIVINNRFPTPSEPMIINIQSESQSLAVGIGDNISQPVKKAAPEMNIRVTKTVEKNAVPEKTLPRHETINNINSIQDTIKEGLKNIPIPDPQKELNKETIKEEVVKNENVNTSDKQMSSFMTEDINKNQEKKSVNKELSQIAGDIDKALKESEGQGVSVSGKENGVTGGTGAGKAGTGGFGMPSGGEDPLSGVNWSSKPRKTVFFPDIQSKIPDEYKIKGMSYSITAKIAFDRNGLAIRVDIVRSSGDPIIDRIFFTELKKIRIESIDENRIDEISKSFSINLK